VHIRSYKSKQVNKETAISEVMSTKLITLHPKDKLQRAKDIFKQYDIHHIPVVVMNKIVGIVSQGDILYLESVITHSFDRFIIEKRFELDTIDQVMTPDPICTTSAQTVSEVLDTMLNQGINALPVVDDGQLVGLVTSQDFLRILDSIFDKNQ